jgi:hypothetical protein
MRLQADDAAAALERVDERDVRFDHRKLVGVKLISGSVHTGAGRVG